MVLTHVVIRRSLSVSPPVLPTAVTLPIALIGTASIFFAWTVGYGIGTLLIALFS